MTEPLSEERLAAIEERASAAKHLPWSLGPRTAKYRALYPHLPLHIQEFDALSVGDDRRGTFALIPLDESNRATAVFIEHARTDVPDLLAEVRRLTVLNDQLWEKLRAITVAIPEHTNSSMQDEVARIARERDALREENAALAKSSANEYRYAATLYGLLVAEDAPLKDWTVGKVRDLTAEVERRFRDHLWCLECGSPCKDQDRHAHPCEALVPPKGLPPDVAPPLDVRPGAPSRCGRRPANFRGVGGQRVCVIHHLAEGKEQRPKTREEFKREHSGCDMSGRVLRAEPRHGISAQAQIVVCRKHGAFWFGDLVLEYQTIGPDGGPP